MDKRTLKQLQKDVRESAIKLENRKSLETRVKTEILYDNVYMTKPKEEEKQSRILDPIGDFRMSDEDFKDYCIKVYDRLVQAGATDIPDYNTTATANQETALKAAENAMLDAFLPLVPKSLQGALDKARNDYKYRQELINITLQVDVDTMPIGK